MGILVRSRPESRWRSWADPKREEIHQQSRSQATVVEGSSGGETGGVLGGVSQADKENGGEAS